MVGAYGLTTGSGIVEALVRAKQRGVDVRLIADKTTPCARGSGIEPLAAAGVPIWIDTQARIAHAKTMVIDGAVTFTGSMNLDPRRSGELRRPQLSVVPGCRDGLRGALAQSPCRLRSVWSSRGPLPGGVGSGMTMIDGPLRRLFWRVVDDL